MNDALDIFDYDLTRFNETDVREAIVAPLLAHLGYRRGTKHDIRTEQSLTYPKNFLGRKKANDPPLRGRADYTLDVDKRIRWVVEAKAPGEPLDTEVVEQAYSYAVHAEVAAVYFCVTNGYEFNVYQTTQGVHTPPIFACSYAELRDKISIIENVLGPEAIIRANPTYVLDLKPSLGPGLGSLTRIVNGRVVFGQNSVDFRPMTDLIMSVSSGSVEHGENDGMVANLTIVAMNARMHALNEKLGLDKMTLVSTSDRISTDPDAPTAFSSETRVVMAAGEVMLNLMTWSDVVLPCNVTSQVKTRATGFVSNRVFTGKFESIHQVFLPAPYSSQTFSMVGEVTLQLA